MPISRAGWFREALTAEQAGSPVTAKAIIAATIEVGLEALEKPARWLENAEEALKGACVECAREVLAAGQKVMPDDLQLWRARISLEKRVSGTLLEAMFRGATEHCSSDVQLWLEFADYEATKGATQEAVNVLESAVKLHPADLSLHLKLSRLYQVMGDFAKSRAVLLQCDCNKAWKRAALLDLAEGRDASQTLQEGIRKHPTYARLYLLLADLQPTKDAKRAVLTRATENCGTQAADSLPPRLRTDQGTSASSCAVGDEEACRRARRCGWLQRDSRIARSRPGTFSRKPDATAATRSCGWRRSSSSSVPATRSRRRRCSPKA